MYYIINISILRYNIMYLTEIHGIRCTENQIHKIRPAPIAVLGLPDIIIMLLIMLPD